MKMGEGGWALVGEWGGRDRTYMTNEGAFPLGGFDESWDEFFPPVAVVCVPIDG